jgi:hypothetical protein
LLGTNPQEIVLHWFTADGEFIGVEKRRLDVGPPPTFPGTTIHQRSPAYAALVQREVDALMDVIGFEWGEIRIRKFSCDEASIEDLPGDYVRFLEDPASFDDEDREHLPALIRKFRRSGMYVLAWNEQYWVKKSGEIEGN